MGEQSYRCRPEPWGTKKRIRIDIHSIYLDLQDHSMNLLMK